MISRSNLVTLVLFAVILSLIVMLLRVDPAEAHRVTKKHCISIVNERQITSYTAWRYYVKKCHRKAKRHNKRHSVQWNRALSSWYGPGFYGNKTACGKVYTSTMRSVAHKTLPCGTRITLRYKGRKVHVTVEDRGPYAHGRIFDLSNGARTSLGFTGVSTVRWSRGWK